MFVKSFINIYWWPNINFIVNWIFYFINPASHTNKYLHNPLIVNKTNILFITNYLKNNKIAFNSNNIDHFKNYIGFQYYAVSSLNSLAFRLLKKISKYHIKTYKFKPKRKRLYNSQFRFWLNDFYTDGKDYNSKYSSTMIQCSKMLRLSNTNFNF